MGGERERHLSHTGSLSRWLNSWTWVEARSSCRVSHALSHHLLPVWCVSRKLDHKQSSRDSHWCLGFKAVGLKAGLASCTIMPHNPLCTTVSQYFAFCSSGTLYFTLRENSLDIAFSASTSLAVDLCLVSFSNSRLRTILTFVFSTYFHLSSRHFPC